MAALQLFVLGAVLAVHTSRGNPTHGLKNATHEDIIMAATYLTQYGYSTSYQVADKSGLLGSFSDNLVEFQRFAGLEETGVLDLATVMKMRQPRCGVKDKLGPSYRARRRKRYALHGSRWGTKNLKYKIMNWPSGPLRYEKEGVRQAFRESYKAWSDVADLTFQEVPKTAEANTDIWFRTGDHGDNDPFDGPSGVLAHAYFPDGGGNAHFDDSENWTVDLNRRTGIDLFTVASHELGHSLGLKHSDDERALMAPFYKPPSLNRDVVKEDDIKAIQALYGPPANRPPVAGNPVPKPREPSPPRGSGQPSPPRGSGQPDQILCSDSSIDTMLTFEVNGKKRTFAFKGANFWLLEGYGVAQGYPRRIRDVWGGVPDNLDAILPYEESNSIYFFKGSQYWRMTNMQMDTGSPKPISRGFPGIPDNIDAAFKWAANGKMYFFKGSQYWRFETDSSGRSGVSNRYPQPISTFRGIPNNIDAVLTYENKGTYFFKGNSFYRFSDVDFKVDSSKYPRSTGRYWFGCDSQRSNLVKPAINSAGRSAGE